MNGWIDILAPFLGRSWRGEFSASTPEHPMVDVASFELALNGQAVRGLHSINDGEYGGETIYLAGAGPTEAAYFYFTTAGFRSEGSLRREGNVLSARESIVGEAGGIKEVRATMTILSDTEYVVKSEYLKEGAWVAGRETHYHASPGAQVKFRPAS
jgi:hypothetical protein